MTLTTPVYTLENECHDCYKCVRQCYVKAIKVKNGHASVIPGRCVACGHCVEVCPAKAKRVRDDVNAVRALLAKGEPVYVSLAPSWAGLLDCSKNEVVGALKALGFAGVSETALGAQEVSLRCAELVKSENKRLFISTACPAVVDFIRLYRPDFAKDLTPVGSPAMTHAALLKKHYGEEAKVVFIGPCIAKKNEADRHPDLISAALTFKELAAWMDEDRISFSDFSEETDGFVPEESHEGAMYPVEGGMNETIRLCGLPDGVRLVCFAGLAKLGMALKNLDKDTLGDKIFIEALACEGGCANGPCANTDKSELNVVADVLGSIKKRDIIPSKPETVVTAHFDATPVERKKYPVSLIAEALALTGKYTPEDELNCGGCGYDTCRKMAEALIAGDAEPSMCQSYMRKLAARKAGAMLRCMPSAAVIVDADLKVVESNEAFVRMFAPELDELFKSETDGIAGADLSKILPCFNLFDNVLKTGIDVHKDHYPIGGKLYDISLFSIDEGKLVGAIVTDVTETQMRHEQIAKKAREVIDKNIETVQNIACLLGEHMVNTELLLSQIEEGYEGGEDKK